MLKNTSLVVIARTRAAVHGADHLLPELPADSAADRGQHLVPGAHDRAVRSASTTSSGASPADSRASLPASPPAAAANASAAGAGRPMREPMVKAEGVRKSFGRIEVLKGIKLEVQPREVFCIVGPSGSGKSTFLRCINHLEQINAGRLCGGRRVGRLPARATSCTSCVRRKSRASGGDRDGVPALQPVSAHDRDGEHRGGAVRVKESPRMR